MRTEAKRTDLSDRCADEPTAVPSQEGYLFSVLPASCRQNETMRDPKTSRRDAGSTLERHHETPLIRCDAGSRYAVHDPFSVAVLLPRMEPPHSRRKSKSRRSQSAATEGF